MKNNPFPVFKHLTKKEFLLIRERKWDRIRIEIQVRGSLDGKGGGRWKIKETFCEGRKEGGGGACHIFYFAETYEAGLIGRSPGFIYKFERSLSSPSRHCVARNTGPRERYNSDEKVGILSLSLSLSSSLPLRGLERR